MHLVPMMVSKLQGLFSPPNQRIEGGGNKKNPVSSLPPAICYPIYKAAPFWETKVEIEENTQQ